MKLPYLLSVPHAGLAVPPEVEKLNLLTPEQVAADGDVFAAEIYLLDDEVEVLVRTDIARAFVDQNRAEDDFRKDGIIKTHTCWDEPIYEKPLSPELAANLIDRYWRPYHRRLIEAASPKLPLAVDCHTMAAAGPPIGPDPGVVRPAACLSNADGTCPPGWVESFAEIFEKELGHEVRINDPFKGGYICRSHSKEMPWIQLELSRGDYLEPAAKREAVLATLRAWRPPSA